VKAVEVYFVVTQNFCCKGKPFIRWQYRLLVHVCRINKFLSLFLPSNFSLFFLFYFESETNLNPIIFPLTVCMKDLFVPCIIVVALVLKQ